eukprot:1653198-Pyramimonas_sp.AAC.1
MVGGSLAFLDGDEGDDGHGGDDGDDDDDDDDDDEATRTMMMMMMMKTTIFFIHRLRGKQKSTLRQSVDCMRANCIKSVPVAGNGCPSYLGCAARGTGSYDERRTCCVLYLGWQ